MADELAHMHCHFHTSGFDGLGEAEQFAQRAAEMGQSAIALTDHGTLRGLYEAQKACDEAGVKLVPGCEFYLTDDASKRGATPEEKDAIMSAHATVADGKAALKADDQRRRSRDHVTVWALNPEGLRNLYRLSGWSWSEGFYYKPRIDLARLREYGAGLAVSTGCPGGVVAGPLAEGRVMDALDRTEELALSFGDRFYVEIMPHVLEGRERVASRLLRIAADYGAKVIATQDAHYPTAMDADAQEALLCVHTRARLCDADRFCFDSKNYWLRSRAELEAAFATALPMVDPRIVQAAIEQTNALADRCTARLELGKPGQYLVAPVVPAEYDGDFDLWLWALCKDGVRDRFRCEFNALGADYRARLLHELRTIRDLGFAGYFVAVWDVRAWARGAGILCGPGRGSAAGSLVSYVLRITDLDPVAHGLSFERFLAPGRVDLPDIDCDFESLRRDEVIEYLRGQYGDDRVAHISTHNTIGGKRALRDLGRIYSIPDHLTAPLLPLIAEDEGGKSLAAALRNTGPGQVVARAFPGVADVAARLEGNLRDVGLHAAGVVLASEPLRNFVPMETRPRPGGARVPAVAFDWHGAEAMGLVKLDVLGLRTLTTVAMALRLAGRTVDDIALDDPATLAVFNAGRFAGVFQYDTPSSRRICKDFEFKSFADIAVITALNRPGPITSGLVTEFMARRADPAKVYSVHPVYDEIMAETLGVPVYQEQVVALARRLAGYSAEDADKCRKAISKKDGFEEHEDRFVGGACDNGMAPAAARALWKQLVGFAKYAFNKAHSFSYGALAVWTAWLKAHCPAAFYAASMATSEDEEARLRLASEARNAGVPIMPPSVQVGGEGFALRKLADGTEEIVGSVGDIKGVGPATALAIAKRAPFTTLVDFYERTAGAGVRVTARTFEALARATAFRDLVSSSRPLVDDPKGVWEALAAVHKVRTEGAPKAKRKRKGEVEAPLLTAEAAELEAMGALVEAVRLRGPEYTQDEWIRVVSAVWPLYVSLEGRSLFDAEEAKVRAACKRGTVHLPGEELAVGQFVVMFARVASFKVYREEGGQSGRVVLTVPGGGEVVGRMDDDVVQAYASGIAEGGLVLVAAYCHKEGRCAVEAIWPSSFDGASVLLDRVMRPIKSKPRDPGSAMRSALEGESFNVHGSVLRVRRHTDKTGGRMMTVGLLGERGYVRFFVFARRAKLADCEAIVPGAHVSVRLSKLTDACCLADGPRALEVR